MVLSKQGYFCSALLRDLSYFSIMHLQDINGIVRFPFLELSIIILGIKTQDLEVGEPSVQSLVRLHACVSLPGYILVAKSNNSRFQQEKENDIYY